ncbi:MAG: tyrosine-type recombinase/integrase [Bacteroidales bacterium]|nr:tyrosine-type recombinase/integrase [Bacteroidales bacterium]
MTINYLLRSTNRYKPVTIYLRFRESNISWYFATPFSIMVKQWNARRGMPYPGKTTFEQSGLKELTNKLNELEKVIVLFTERCRLRNRNYSHDDIEDIINNFEIPIQLTTEVPYHIADYLNYLIGAMMNGTFKYQSANYDENTIKVWKNFRDVYIQFEKAFERRTGKILEWETIDKSVYDGFVQFCEEWGYMPKSINKLLICFKAAINYSAEYHHLHTNLHCIKYFTKLRIIKGDTQTKVYLTIEELSDLYNMRLKKGSMKDKVRDVFLVGCYTGQRISDYGRLTKENFTYTSKGTKVVSILQEKTNNYVMVPVLTDKLVHIVEKYNYNLPHLSDVVINRYIKTICKDLSAKTPSLAEKIVTTPTMRELNAEKKGKMTLEKDEFGNVVKPKYMLVTTHTARRSCITNLYKSQLFSTYQIMSISGHKSESTFWKYLSESTEEIAEEIAEIRRKLIDNPKIANGNLF